MSIQNVPANLTGQKIADKECTFWFVDFQLQSSRGYRITSATSGKKYDISEEGLKAVWLGRVSMEDAIDAGDAVGVPRGRQYAFPATQAVLTHPPEGIFGISAESFTMPEPKPTPVDDRWNSTCKCGAPAYTGFSSVECSRGCK